MQAVEEEGGLCSILSGYISLKPISLHYRYLDRLFPADPIQLSTLRAVIFFDTSTVTAAFHDNHETVVFIDSIIFPVLLSMK